MGHLRYGVRPRTHSTHSHRPDMLHSTWNIEGFWCAMFASRRVYGQHRRGYLGLAA